MSQPLLEERLGYTFRKPALLAEALTHASSPAKKLNNERLEFLGDRVVGLVIAQALYDRFPKAREGDLAARHAHLVSREMLTQVAEALKLGESLKVSREVTATSARHKSLLANGCEAVIGALFMDGGFESASSFILRLWEEALKECEIFERDAKSLLQEWAQGMKKPVPTYAILQKTGPDHSPFFEISVHVEGLETVTGKGTSKREAEQEAAKTLLNFIRGKDFYV